MFFIIIKKEQPYRMNLQVYMVMIYFSAGIYAWRPFNRNFEHNKKLEIQSKYAGGTITESKNNSGNTTNDTFMDDEEFMKLLRFYRPM